MAKTEKQKHVSELCKAVTAAALKVYEVKEAGGNYYNELEPLKTQWRKLLDYLETS